MNRKEAQAEGAALLAQLGSAGAGWHVNVWPNQGWHACIVSPCGRLKVHRSLVGSGYVVYLGDPSSAGGTWVGRGATPSAAIEDAVKQGRAALARYEDLLRGL